MVQTQKFILTYHIKFHDVYFFMGIILDLKAAFFWGGGQFKYACSCYKVFRIRGCLADSDPFEGTINRNKISNINKKAKQ